MNAHQRRKARRDLLKKGLDRWFNRPRKKFRHVAPMCFCVYCRVFYR